jgi:hypothetical protein
MSAFGGKADMTFCGANLRLTDEGQRRPSVKPFDESPRNLAPSDTTPSKALGKGVDLIVVTPGKCK